MEKEFEKLGKNIITSKTPKNDSKKLFININPSFTKDIKIEEKNKITDLNKSEISNSRTERENLLLNELINKEDNYSIELENEEEEFDSNEYISSTMLDVETNTYIEIIDKKSNISNSLINKENSNKSPSNLGSQKFKNFIKAININNNDYLHKNNKSKNSNSDGKKNKNNNYISSSPKLKSNNTKKDILYKKLNIQKKIERMYEKNKKLKKRKNIKIDSKNIEKEKNYSIIGNKSPLNIIYSKENIFKLDRTNINLINLIKNKNSEKNEYKKIKNIINEKNKTNKQERTSNVIKSKNFINTKKNNNSNMKETLVKKQYKKINNTKDERRNVFSPNNKKFDINSMKKLNLLNTINNSKTPSSSLANNIINKNRIIYYNTNNNLIKSKNKINTNNNSNNNNTINFNNLNNNRNNITFSPLKRLIDKKLNRNTTPSYSKNPFISNSLSIENSHNISNNINGNIKKSNKLLTYNTQVKKYLSRNRTFKNKRHLHNKNKYFNLFLNKKKMNLMYEKDINNYKGNSKSKSPKTQIKINNLKKITENKIKKKNQNIQMKINISKLENKNICNYMSKNSYLNSYINSYSNRKQNEQNISNNLNLYKRDRKNDHKQFIYIKKENLSNIIHHTNNKNYDFNPFNQENKNNLSLSKSNKKYFNNGNLENREFNSNLTSINLIKNVIKNKKIKLEIGNKKKNKFRAKTLIEEDYLKDIFTNNKDIKENENNKENYFKGFKFCKNNESESNNLNINPLNYKGIYSKYCERKTNISPSKKDIIIKSPSERHDINLNININMNNNDYKKLICYYGPTNSSINYSYTNKKERNSNLPFNKIIKREKNIVRKRGFGKINSKDILNNNSNCINGGEYIDINNIINNSEIVANSLNNNYNNIFDQYYGNSSSILNKKNFEKYYISKNIKKQLTSYQNKKNNNKKYNIKKRASLNEKNSDIYNTKKKEYIQMLKNNDNSNSGYEKSKSLHINGSSNKDIHLLKNNSRINNFYKINKNKGNYVIINNKKNLNQKYASIVRSQLNEIKEFNEKKIENNLTNINNYIHKLYSDNKNSDN